MMNFWFGVALLLIQPGALGFVAQNFVKIPSSSSSSSSSTRLFDVEEDDWRAFRAKLINQEKKDDFITSPFEEGWAIEQTLVEPGSVLVHTPTKADAYGLSNQFLYKAVVLIVERSPEETIGLILNRPTDVELEAEEGDFSSKMLYGGNLFSLHGDDPKFYCLHSTIPGQEDDDPIMSGLSFCSIDHAKILVKEGLASSEDFTVVCGCISCPSAELEAERENGEWKSLSMDSKSLYEALGQGTANSVWSHLKTITGDDRPNVVSSFDDRILEAWSNTHLIFEDTDEEDDSQKTSSSTLKAGQLLRSSSHTHAFLFDNQEFHKSLMLVLQEDDTFSVGVILNHPTSAIEEATQLPIRYGGNFDQLDIDEGMPPFCVHRLGGVIGGEPVGDNLFWKASMDQALDAIEQDLAQNTDFLVVRGLSIWAKGDGEGLNEHVENGMFEIVPSENLDDAWRSLQDQKPLSERTVGKNVNDAFEAWKLSGGEALEGSAEEVNLNILGLDAVKVWLKTNLL